MANWGKVDSSFDDMAGSPAAPAGMKQAADRYSYQLEQYASGDSQQRPWVPQDAGQLARNWYTGQNTMGVDNGWNTPFYQKFFAQDEEYRQRAAKEDNQSIYFQQFQDPSKKETGIALWDDPNGKFRVGDVFVDGQVRENVYDSMGDDQANWLLGSLYVSGSGNAQLFKKRDQAGYAEEIESKKREWSDLAKYSASAHEYEQDVEENAETIREGVGDSVITAGGVLGGVITGAGLGTIVGGTAGAITGPGAVVTGAAGAIVGGIVGGIAGLFGAELNEDELIDMAARAYTRQQQIAEEFSGVEEIFAYGHAVEQWSPLAMRFLSPVSNTVRGAKELLDGDRGDGEVDWYGTDENGNPNTSMKWKALDLAGSFADSAGQFGTPVGRAAYTGVMGAGTAGRVSGDVLTDSNFDEATGQFHEYENNGQRLAAYGSIGIDAIQTAVPGLMTRAMRHSREAAGLRLNEWTGKVGPAQGVRNADDEVMAATRFIRDADGKVVDAKWTLEQFVPSEMVRKGAVKLRARQLARRDGDGAIVTPDHMYRAAYELSGGSQWKSALLNASAEGYEEFAQTYLDEASFGRQAQFRQAMEAAAYGGATGLGMGMGRLNYRPSRDTVLDERRRMRFNERTGQDLDPEQWKQQKQRMSKRAIETLDVATPDEDARAARLRQVAAEQMRRGRADSPLAEAGMRVFGPEVRDAELKAANDMGGDALQAFGQETDLTWIPGAVDPKTGKRGRSQIDPKSDKHGANTVTMSFSQVMTSLGKKADAVEEQLEQQANELRDYNSQITSLGEQLQNSALSAQDRQSLEIELQTAERNAKIRTENVADLEMQVRAARVLLRERDGSGRVVSEGALMEEFRKFSKERDGKTRNQILNGFNKKLTDLYRMRVSLSDDQGVIDAEAAKSVVELLLPRHPTQDRGSYNLMLPRVSKMMTRYNSHRIAGIHQAVLKALGADHDGDNLVQQFDLYVTKEQRKNLRRGLQYMRYQGQIATDLVDDSGKLIPADGGPRKWEVNIDAPSSEEAYIQTFSSKANSAASTLIVEQGLARLKSRLMSRYVKGGPKDQRPKPLKNHAAGFEKAIDEFILDVQAGVTNARVDFAQKMWDLNAEGLFAMSDETGVPEITQLWVMITTEFENIRGGLGQHKYAVSDPSVDPEVKAARPDDTDELGKRARLWAANIGQLMSMFGGTAEPRPSQFVHYEPLQTASIDWGVARREETMKRAETSPELAVSALYRMLGSGLEESDLEALDSKNRVKRRAIRWLEQIAEDFAKEGDTDPKRLFLVIAAMEAGNFDGNPDVGEAVTMGEGPISLLQLLLRRSVQIEETVYANREEGGQKDVELAVLKRLSYPSGKRSKTSAEAMVELLGDIGAYDLLGEEGLFFGANLTMRQHMDLLLSMDQHVARREWGKYKWVPSYFKTADKADPIVPIYTVDQLMTLTDPSPDDDGVPQINGYTIMVDAVQTAAAAERARRRERSADKVELATNGVRRLRDVVRSWYDIPENKARIDKATNGKATRRDKFRDMLKYNPDVADLVVELVPEASREFVFQLRNGTPTVARFLEDVLMDDNVDRGLAQFYVFTKLSEWAVLMRKPLQPEAYAKFDEDKNRWVLPEWETLGLDDPNVRDVVRPEQLDSQFLETLYYLNTLNDGGMEVMRFFTTIMEAPSLHDMFTSINSEPTWLFDRSELFPFFDSSKDYQLQPSDPYSTGGSADAKYREQLENFSSKIDRVAQSLSSATKTFKRNESTIRRMAAQNEYEKNPRRNKRPDRDAAQLLVFLDKSLEHVRMFGDLVGPGIRMQIMDAMDQMLLRLHDKGKSDDRLKGIAEVRATVDSIGFGSAMVLEFDAIHAYSWEAVAQSPSMLVEGPIRIMLKDGSVFELDLSTRDGILEALSDQVTQPFALAVVGTITRDINNYNVAQMYMDSEMMPADGGPIDIALMLAESATNAKLFNDEGSEFEQAMRLLSFVEAKLAKSALGAKNDKDIMDGYYPIMRMIHELQEAYQTTSGMGRSKSETERLHRELIIEMANALKMIGSLRSPDQIEDVKNILFGIQKSKQKNWVILDELFSTETDKESKAAMQEMLEEVVLNQLSAEEARENTRLNQMRSEGASEAELVEQARRQQRITNKLLKFEGSRDFNDLDDMTAMDWNSAAKMFHLSGAPEDKTNDALTKMAIITYLMEGSRIAKFEDTKAAVDYKNSPGSSSIQALLENFLSNVKKWDGGLDAIDQFDLDPALWDQLSIFSTVMLLGERAGRSSTDVKALPVTAKNVAEFQRLHDSTWTSLLDQLFNPKTWEAMRYLTRLSSGTTYVDDPDVPTTTAEIATQLSKTLLSDRKVGQWNPAVVTNIQKMDLAMRQARSGIEIPKGGDYPKIFGPANGVMSGITYDIPPDEFLTQFEYTLDPTLSLQEQFAIEDYVVLHNHFVRGVQYTAPDGTVIDITSAVSDVDTTNDDTKNSGLRVLDVMEMIRQADRRTKNFNGGTLSLVVVDIRKQPFDTPEWANNRFFDGRGRDTPALSETSLLASMVFGTGAESKALQQGPLNVLSKNGELPAPYRNANLEEVRRLEIGDIKDVLMRKAWHMLTRSFPMSALSLDDIGAMYNYIRLHHVVVGRNTQTGKKEVWWAQEYMRRIEAGITVPLVDLNDSNKPPKLVALERSVADRIYGGSGFDKNDSQRPLLNIQDLPSVPDLNQKRLERLGLGRLGEETSLKESPVGQFRPLQRVNPYSTGSNTVRTGHEFDVEQAAKRSSAVMKARGEQRGMNIDERSETVQSKAWDLLRAEPAQFEDLLFQLGVPMADPLGIAERLRLERSVQALRQLEEVRQSRNVWWEHRDDFDTDDVVRGILSRNSLDSIDGSSAESVIFGDVVVIDLESIYSKAATEKKAIERMKVVLDAYTKLGTTLMIGSSRPNSSLQNEAAAYLTAGPSQVRYKAAAMGGGHVYVPVTENRWIDRTREAYDSDLTALDQDAGKNANVVHMPLAAPGLNENVRQNTDRFWEVVRRCVVQLAPRNFNLRMSWTNVMAFSLPEESIDDSRWTEDKQALLTYARTKEGRAELLRRLGSEGTNQVFRRHKGGTYTPGVRSSEEALDIFLKTLEAGKLPLGIDSEVLTGDLYLAIAPQGEILIQRVGYKMPKNALDRRSIRKQWDEPLGGVGGPRIALFGSKPNPNLTKLPPFKVTEIDDRSQDGILLRGEHDLDWFKKMVGHGIKTQDGTMPTGLTYAGGLSRYNDTAIGSRIGRKDINDKNAGRGTVSTWRNFWALVGVDFTQDLTDLLVPEEQFGDLTYEDRRDRMMYMLRSFARMNNELTGEDASKLLEDPLRAFGMLHDMNRRAMAEMGDDALTLLPAALMPDQTSGRLTDDGRLLQIFLVTLSIAGMQPEQLMSVPGLLTIENPTTTDSVFGYLPSVFTEAFSSLKYPGLRERMLERGNAVIPEFEDKNTKEMVKSGWFDGNFVYYAVMEQREKGGGVHYDVVPGRLQIETPLPADENAINLAFGLPGARDASYHLARTASGQGFYSTLKQPRRDKDGRPVPSNTADRYYGEDDYEEFDDEAIIYDFLTRVAPNVDEAYFPGKYWMPQEHAMFLDADDKMGGFLFSANRVSQEWPDNGRAQVFLQKMNLSPNDLHEVDYLVRQFVGAPAPKRDSNEIDSLTHAAYVQAVDQMITNIENGWHPLHGGDVPMEHHSFWYKLFLANQAPGDNAPWAPVARTSRLGRGKKASQDDWAEWVNTLMGQVRNSNKEFHTMFASPLAGFLHTYQQTVPNYNTQPLTMDAQKNAQLVDGENNEFVVSIDKGAASLAHNPAILETMKATWKVIAGHKPDSYEPWAAVDTPASSVVYRAKQRAAWLEKNIKRQKKGKMRDYAREGLEHRESLNAQHIFLHSLMHISIVNRLLNLGLYFGAPIEVGFRNMLDSTTDALLGQSTGATGSVFGWVGKVTGENGPKPRFTADQQKRINKVGRIVGGDPRWRGQLMGETTYRQGLVSPIGELDENGEPVDRGWRGKWGWGAFWERAAGITATVINDPTWGMRKASAGKRYVKGVLEYLESTDNYIDFDVLMRELADDPLWVYKNFPRSGLTPHKFGANAVAQVRSTRGTLLGDTIMRPVDKLYNSDSAMKVAAGVLLKMPLAFTRFQANAFLTLTGLGALDSLAAAHLHDRQTVGSWVKQRYQAWSNQEIDPPEYADYSDVLETYDFERLVLRGVVSQVGLATAAMYGFSVLGLGGEDEEERKRRLRDMYMRIPAIYDPREAENGFEYADAIWLDEVPILGMFWQRNLGGENRSPVVPHWILRQFTSPLMGVVRAFGTGDFSNVRQGFLDAASVIPNNLLNLWREADYTYGLMHMDAQELAAEGVDTPERTSRIAWMFVNGVGVYEKALVENQMFNAIISANDEVARNPYKIPKTTKTGELVLEEGTGYPVPTTALTTAQGEPLLDPVTNEPMLDSKGEPLFIDNRTEYASRTGMDAIAHNYSKNNAVFAIAMNLMPGQGFYMRNQMVPKKDLIPVALGAEDELKALAWSAFYGAGGADTFTKDEIAYALKYQYQKNNQRWEQTQIDKQAETLYKEMKDIPLTTLDPAVGEIITNDGAKGVFKSLLAGWITMDSPVLQGAHFPLEMRQQVATEMLDDIVQQSIDMGMSPQSAEYRKRRLWFGDYSTGVPGLKQFVYNDALPYKPYQEYTQLNVTFAPGPDGSMWATPFTRTNWLGAIGIPVPHSMEPLPEGLGYDTRGNVVNYLTNTNTGGKAIVPGVINEKIEPDDKPLRDSKDAKTTTSSNWGGKWYGGGYSRRGYGYGGRGGGYSSGGYPTTIFTDKILRAIRAGYGPQMEGSYGPRADNPIVRRADVRRERVTSERGRLKQWQ